MQYKDCKPIKPTLCTAWLIVYEPVVFAGRTIKNERRFIQLWSKDATMQDVKEFCIVHREGFSKKFTITNIDVGTFEVKGIFESYSTDGRKLNQNGEIQL